jgi:hypothetical protein
MDRLEEKNGTISAAVTLEVELTAEDQVAVEPEDFVPVPDL